MNITPPKKPALPRDWKKQISERLTNKGIQLTQHQVYDLAKDRSKDPVLQKEVLSEVQKLSKEHQKQLADVARLKAKTPFLSN